jgi:hypothetical protein
MLSRHFYFIFIVLNYVPAVIVITFVRLGSIVPLPLASLPPPTHRHTTTTANDAPCSAQSEISKIRREKNPDFCLLLQKRDVETSSAQVSTKRRLACEKDLVSGGICIKRTASQSFV